MKRTSTLLLFLAIPRSHITTQGTAQIATDTIFESYDVQKLPSFTGGEAMIGCLAGYLPNATANL